MTTNSDANITIASVITGDYDDDYLLLDDDYEEDDWWPAYVTWIQKVFASLSIICAYVICREILSDMKAASQGQGRRRSTGDREKLQGSIGRILLNLNIADIIYSFAIFLGEWPAPKDTLYIHHAKGNQQLCTFQGWLQALGYLASPMFSVVLNAFSLLLIRYRWQDADLSRLEKKITIGIWTYALILSIIPIPLNSYNSDADVCWIVPAPMDCVGDECTRGLSAYNLEIYYSFIHIWVCILICAVLMIALFHFVKNMETKVKQYKSSAMISTRACSNNNASSTKIACKIDEQSDDDGDRDGNIAEKTKGPPDDNDEEAPQDAEEQPEVQGRTKKSVSISESIAGATRASLSFVKKRSSSLFPVLVSKSHQNSRAVAYQGILYTLAFMSTHLLDIIASIIWRTNETWSLGLDIAAYMIFQPSLGILNFLIFCRTRKTMVTPEGRWLRYVVFCSGCCGKSSEAPWNTADGQASSSGSSRTRFLTSTESNPAAEVSIEFSGIQQSNPQNSTSTLFAP